ncbi:hypothetical protein MMC18_002774 [Xylographa bjoerkii]|nr:hypothetical protein [Xylographa bjoerkii]
MSSPAPAPKRRKTSALFKPFKSPLKTPLKPSSNPAHPPPIPATGPNAEKEPYHPSPLSTTTSSSAKPSTTLPPPSDPTPPNPHLSSTLKIESSAKDAELTRLIALWRLAARQAAEEIFAGVRDRVNRMGGVGAWREREREGRERWGGGGWDDGENKSERDVQDGNREEEGVEERREREGGEESDRREERRRRDGDTRDDAVSAVYCSLRTSVCSADERSVQGFTMDMMLTSLNIELGVIGYDKEMQRWID